jgi:uncharacterized membrane protein
MSETLLRIVSIAPTIFFLFFLGLFMPKLVRREIFFGARIPPDRIETDSVKKISAWYRNSYLLIAGAVSLLLLGVCFVSASPIPILIGVFGLIFIQFGLYSRAHKDALRLKKEKGWFSGKTETVVVDTSFRKQTILVTPWWFLVPVGMIVLDAVLGIRAYPTLPNKIAMHFDQLGRPDRWSGKSAWTLFAIPLNLVWITTLTFFIYRIIGWSKQELRADDPEASLKQQTIFRRRWSGFIIFLNVMVCGLMSFFFFQALQMIHPGPHLIMGIPVGFTIVLLGVTLILAFQTGQGGSRIRSSGKPKNTNVTNRNDDKYWKWGLFYYNPDDPSMFVEKRFGVGWTTNFGNWKVNWIIISIILLVILIFIVLSNLNYS